VERGVDYEGLTDICLAVVGAIEAQQWRALGAFTVRSYTEIVCKFYASKYEVRRNSFKTFLRGVDIKINAYVISSFCQVPWVEGSPHPYDSSSVQTSQDLCLCFSNGSHNIWSSASYPLKHFTLDKRMLSRMLTHNLYSSISFPIACLLYALCHQVPVDFGRLEVEAMVEVHRSTLFSIALAYVGMITCLAGFRSSLGPLDSTMDPMWQFDRATTLTSLAHAQPQS
jgi:hypothetical protein